MTAVPGLAWTVVDGALTRSGVQIRPLHTMDEMSVACSLFDEVWGLGPGETSEIQPPLLRALEHSGSYVVGAFRGSLMVAASVAFLAFPPAPIDQDPSSRSSIGSPGRGLHSHITGVLPDVAGSGVGAALKWHQRAWALDRGLNTITWTYDPLIARNSFFNVARLGATPQEYLVDFYGLMTDGLNVGQPSDRALAVWELTSRRVLDRAAGASAAPAPESPWRLAADGRGRPEVRTLPETADTVRIAVPADVEAMRRSDPGAALAWRLAVRECLAPLIEDPAWRVSGFDKAGAYVMTRVTANQPEGAR